MINEFNPVKYTDLIMVLGWALMILGVTLLVTMLVLRLTRKEKDQ